MIHVCKAKIRVGAGFHRQSCNKTAKVEHDGQWYCGTHDPVKCKARSDARHAKWLADHNARHADRLAARQRLELGERAIDALRQIADGHNDARALAIEILGK